MRRTNLTTKIADPDRVVLMKPLLIAIGASLGNALFIYSQRASPEAPNPFLFSAGTVLFAAVFCGLASFWTKSDSDTQYLLSAWPYMMLGGIGVFITFVGFFYSILDLALHSICS